VSEKLFQMAQDSKYQIKSCVVTDQEALQSCFNFASDHRMLVGLGNSTSHPKMILFSSDSLFLGWSSPDYKWELIMLQLAI